MNFGPATWFKFIVNEWPGMKLIILRAKTIPRESNIDQFDLIVCLLGEGRIFPYLFHLLSSEPHARLLLY